MVERILLIDVDNRRDSDSTSQLYSNWSHHPLGLMSLAAAAREAVPGLQFEIFHTATSHDPATRVEDLLQRVEPHLVGLRALSIAQVPFTRLARLIRERRPRVPIIAGGAYPSTEFRSILVDDLADLVVIGEGEQTFVEILARLRKDSALPHDVAGTALKIGDDILINPPRAPISDLDSLPFPAYDLIDLQDYASLSNHAFQNASRCAFICSSRGCLYRCFYCHQLFGKKIRRRSPESVVEEMRRHVEERGIRSFVFVDDVFNVPQREAKAVLTKIALELPGVRLNFPNGLRADQLDDELIDLFQEAGTLHMALAIETASPRLQKLTGKNLNLTRARRALDAITRRFISCAFFMVGFPTETYEDALETIRFAQGFDHLTQPVLSVMRLYNGTPLYDMLEPDAEQARAITAQEQGIFQTRLFEDPRFYGDLFSDEQVPLSTRQIQAIRYIWTRDVLGNKTRIRNAHKVLQHHLAPEEILEFYRNLYDQPGFNERSLARILGEDGRSCRKNGLETQAIGGG